MSKKEKKILLILFVAYYLIWLLASIYVIQTHQSDKYLTIPVAALTSVIVPVVFHLIHLHSTFELVFVNLIFSFIACVCGTLLGFYAIPYFDKFLHFTSGILMSTLSLMIYSYLKKTTQFKEKNEQMIVLLFINAMNMMIAVFWEFFEYGCLIFLKNDAIHHYTSGVHDSMTDMLVAMIGGWMVAGFLIHYFKTNSKNFLVNLNEKFFEKNLKK